MKRLRISGLVGLAKRVRQELAGPVSDERLAHLRQEVESAVTGITQICREKGIRLQSLPAPSRKALQFLQGLDWDAVVPEEAPAGSRFPPDSLSFRGLPRYFDNLLKRLAQNVDHPELEKIYETLAADSHSLEDDIRRNNIRPEQLKKQARTSRSGRISSGTVPPCAGRNRCFERPVPGRRPRPQRSWSASGRCAGCTASAATPTRSWWTCPPP